MVPFIEDGVYSIEDVVLLIEDGFYPLRMVLLIEDGSTH